MARGMADQIFKNRLIFRLREGVNGPRQRAVPARRTFSAAMDASAPERSTGAGAATARTFAQRGPRWLPVRKKMG